MGPEHMAQIVGSFGAGFRIRAGKILTFCRSACRPSNRQLTRPPPLINAHASKRDMAELRTRPLGVEAESQIEAHPHNTPNGTPNPTIAGAVFLAGEKNQKCQTVTKLLRNPSFMPLGPFNRFNSGGAFRVRRAWRPPALRRCCPRRGGEGCEGRTASAFGPPGSHPIRPL